MYLTMTTRKLSDTSFEDANEGPSARRRNSLPSIPLAIHMESCENLSDIAIKTFESKSVLGKIIPTIIEKLQPALINSIKNALVETLNKKLDPIVMNMEKLTASVSAIFETILESNNKIALLETNVCNLESKCKQLEAKLEATKSGPMHDQHVQDKLDSLEQYSRRHSLRFHSMSVNNAETPSEAIIRVAASKLNISISESDIDRCHYSNRSKTQVICKFSSYGKRRSIYKAKVLLKNDPERIFITEDLTSTRQGMVRQLSNLRKNGKIKSFWTIDGKIFFKYTDDSQPIIVETPSDLESKLNAN